MHRATHVWQVLAMHLVFHAPFQYIIRSFPERDVLLLTSVPVVKTLTAADVTPVAFIQIFPWLSFVRADFPRDAQDFRGAVMGGGGVLTTKKTGSAIPALAQYPVAGMFERLV